MVTTCQQISVTVADKVGKMAELTGAVKEAGVNILALCAWVEGETGRLLMVTDDNETACEAITPKVDKCEFSECVRVTAPNTPGALSDVAANLGDAGIGINLGYATAGDTPQAALVLMTTDNARAAEIL